MTAKIFMTRLANGQVDVVQQFLDLMNDLKIDYCVIGGLAVNAYAEPVVSLDLDLVITVDALDRLLNAAGKYFKIKNFPHRVNLKSSQSELRIQLQTDARYQAFISNASLKNVLGYQMKVAALEDILQGKIWAYADLERRKSKRQKDLADILRLIEAYPQLEEKLPDSIKNQIRD